MHAVRIRLMPVVARHHVFIALRLFISSVSIQFVCIVTALVAVVGVLRNSAFDF